MPEKDKVFNMIALFFLVKGGYSNIRVGRHMEYFNPAITFAFGTCS